MQAPAPSELRYRKDSRELEIAYGVERYTLSAEFLRVHSPSAEVQGHDQRGGVLPLHKENVAITPRNGLVGEVHAAPAQLRLSIFARVAGRKE